MCCLSDEEAGAGVDGYGVTEAGCVSLCGLSASLLISAPGLVELPVSMVASGDWTAWGLRAPRSTFHDLAWEAVEPHCCCTYWLK